MGVFDKLKNALFEEEYVEVEEKPKTKPKKERKRKEKKNKVEDSPIAKKVILPDKKEEEVDVDPVEEKPLDEDFDVEPLKQNTDKFNFPMVEDTDFDSSDDYDTEINKEYSEPEIVKVVEPEEEYSSYKEEKHLYGIDESDRVNVSDYGSYEVEKKIFRPSPIISPIYGVLDKNYKKEEIVNKKEVRLTSSYAREHLSVDDVRNKAYGVNNDEEPKIISTENDKETKKEEDLMVDLTSDDDKPNVKEVTVGDAEEYFEDLGLEYNIDYKDASKEKATGRRSDKNKEEPKEEVQEEQKKASKKKDEPKIEESTDDSDDNLFDLIDSMYEDENQE